ncbi:1-deoxy-D-xylulose-5-phosphate reductoisomerase [Pseudoflavonifractor sp. MSJ-30]|uniref:1-deoxy-D-xylulose-5-phosphate reductoisomerase n=1 Tax=Pseudoflavonifractor sp. MSJ-30 TaxID=2841525 RepID=UPI001C12461D|nr:1-deoxy-D-xylulose-5-phosphate reductoisomerase [Pseudoflavonifractor sp. MSJ-30]MBU5452030.1 1-deoxy-D-xylulose-5-phosphate reductoisomerase [Pseudoflavonifractor sp. MSJ-30]
MIKCVCILGSTGSIGRQSLDVVRMYPQIRVGALTAGSSIARLAEQCREFRPELAVVATKEGADELKQAIRDLPTRVLWGEEGLLAAATLEEADCVITAVVGMLGLKPTLAAIRAGKRIGLANKETLVCAGELVMAQAKQWGAEIVPVDSEHSAIFQCLMGCGDRREVRRLLLTCSGGPFFGMDREALSTVTKADALKHPNWKMGPKITIDCATLMNKGLEVIEAMRLYDLPLEQVDVLIHRQSIVHSLVEFNDGAIMAQLGTPDMRLPIQLAMTYPERLPSPVDRLDLTQCAALTFVKPDLEAFPCLALARDCARRGGNLCAAMNGANEEAVAMFLRDEIGFYDIYRLVQKAVEETPFLRAPALEEILETDRLARLSVKNNI